MNDCKDIIIKFLEENEYDGLLCPEGECGCDNDDLFPCGESALDCIPAYKVNCSELSEEEKEHCEAQPCDNCVSKYLMCKTRGEEQP